MDSFRIFILFYLFLATKITIAYFRIVHVYQADLLAAIINLVRKEGNMELYVYRNQMAY